MINSKWLSQDFYEQMQIDEILMRENEPPFTIQGMYEIENNEERLNTLCPNQSMDALQG